MMKILESFGFDIKIFLAQLFSYLIFFYVLYRYAVTPIQKVLKDRQEKIRESLVNASTATESVERAELEREEILNNAKQEAEKMLKTAEMEASKQRDLIIEKAGKKVEDIFYQGRQAIIHERSKMMDEVQNQLGSMALSMTEKILEREISNKDNQRIVDTTQNYMI